MKESRKRQGIQQLHLPLGKESKTAISADKQRELALALIELLASAVEARNESKTSGGRDEF